MTARRLGVVLMAVVGAAAAYWIGTSRDAPIPLIEIVLVLLGGAVLAASVIGRLTPEIARSWRPELGILPLIAVAAAAIAMISHGMVLATVGALMAGAGAMIVTLRMARLKSSR